jgi:hypothetical protein
VSPRLRSSINVRAISPDQIDDIVDAHLADGRDLSINLITLSRFGTRFGQHLARSNDTSYAAKPLLDLEALAVEYRDKARHDGAPVATWDRFIEFLKTLN